MAVEKVKVTKEVAEAITELRKQGYTDSQIVFGVESGNLGEPLDSYFYEGGVTTDTLLHALVNGYEVEKSPEENVRAYFEQTRKLSTNLGVAAIVKIRAEGTEQGIRNTLDLLEISIEGVNA